MYKSQKRYKQTKKYKEYHKAYMKKYHKKKDRKSTRDSFSERLRRFGLSIEDYNKIFLEQDGCCAICNRHQTEFENRLAVDHDHSTGKIRGLLCFDCNTGLGKLGDNREGILKALAYLEN